jgi:hypothetical protein
MRWPPIPQSMIMVGRAVRRWSMPSEAQLLCGHDFHEDSRQKTVCVWCGLGIEEYREYELKRFQEAL